MARSGDELRAVVVEAALAIRRQTGRSVWELFEDLEPAEASRYEVGLIEGAALALGMTPIELLDELRIEQSD